MAITNKIYTRPTALYGITAAIDRSMHALMTHHRHAWAPRAQLGDGLWPVGMEPSRAPSSHSQPSRLVILARPALAEAYSLTVL